MANIIVALTLLLIFGLAIAKIVIEKRKGVMCVGCSHSGSCSANKSRRSKQVKMQQIEIKEVT